MEPAVHSGRFRLIWNCRFAEGQFTSHFPHKAHPNLTPHSANAPFLSDSVSLHVFPMQEPIRSLVHEINVPGLRVDVFDPPDDFLTHDSG